MKIQHCTSSISVLNSLKATEIVLVQDNYHELEEIDFTAFSSSYFKEWVSSVPYKNTVALFRVKPKVIEKALAA